MYFRPLLAAVVALLPLAGLAETATVGDRAINLTVPKGYCIVEERPRESELLALIRSSMGQRNTLLLVYARCEEVRALRQASPSYAAGLRDYGTISVINLSDKVKPLDGVTRQRFVASALGPLNEALKGAEARLRPEGGTNLGVVDSDDNAAYMASAFDQAGREGAGSQRSVRVAGVTLVRGLRTTVTRIRPLGGAHDVNAVLREQKEALAQFVAANP